MRPSDGLKDFLQRPEAAGQRDECFRMLRHQLLALVHRVHKVQLRDTSVREFLVGHEPRQYAKDPAFVASMKSQGTDVPYLDRKGYAEFLKKNDVLNKDLSRDLGLLKR